MSYKLKLDLFEGPLDLLLFLIRKNDIDICDIPIVQITEQYMDYIDLMQMLDLETVGDFLVMAATLMQIKSKMLIPVDPDNPEEEDDPRDELAQRLMEYEQFKLVADNLQDKERGRKDLIARIMDDDHAKRMRDEAKEVYFEANLFDLINALSDALQRAPEDIIHEIVKEEFTVEQKIHHLLHIVLNEDKVYLSQLFKDSRSKPEMVVTFLAILELIRLKEIKAVQGQVFGDIEICRHKENIEPVTEQRQDFEDDHDEYSIEDDNFNSSQMN